MSEARTPAKIHSSSWHEMHREAVDLAGRLAACGPYRGIVAISRGGLVPAAIVARVLGIRLVETLCISSYDGEIKGPLEVLKTASSEVGDGDGWILIDDVADTGSTAEAARRMLPRARYATLYTKPAGQPFVDTFIRLVDQDVWIDFPWDRDPAPKA
ncbi:MAG: xanthine phosphoribosyltransferase [Rhodospirillales bacterium]|nr:xanthine phosphoribosyltransferase [Rhodospirillales bacterium]